MKSRISKENNYPARTRSSKQITGFFQSDEATTPETTPLGPAAAFAACIRQHLDADQLQELKEQLSIAATQ